MRFYAPSQARSKKDVAGFTKMKYRQDGQASKRDLAGKDAKADIEERELEHFSKLSKEEFLSARDRDLKLLEEREPQREGGDGGGGAKVALNDLDADVEDSDADVPSDEDGSESDSDDDEAELLAELERIRAERAEQARAKEAEAAAREEAEARQMVVGGNPLLQGQLDDRSGANDDEFRMKRRWDDDVVFRNQGASEPAKRKEFINDTVRSDFHKKFMSRYFN